MSGTGIYYFSGTGNSMHIAKELRKRVPETALIPIVSRLSHDKVEACGDSVVLVFPIYRMVAPMPVKDFLKKLDLSSVNYCFAVATRSGTPAGRTFTTLQNILSAKGKSLDGYAALSMGSNDPKGKGWRPATGDELAEIEAVNQKRLDRVARAIGAKERYREEDTYVTTQINPLLGHVGAFFAEAFGYIEENFFCDEECSGCGQCEMVCLAGRIKMKEGHPVWQKDVKCFSCYACLNFCPARAVQIKSNRMMKSYTEQNGRYVHPEATAEEIAAQKESRG